MSNQQNIAEVVIPSSRRPVFYRKKTCPFSGSKAKKIDYKNPKLLRRYVTEKGRMIPSRITGVSNKKQRELAQAIKRSRFLGIDALRSVRKNKSAQLAKDFP